MKQKAFSLDWGKVYQDRINQNEEFRKLASNWSDSIILETIEDKKNVGILFILDKGECKSVKTSNSSDYDKADYVINAKIDVWKKLIDGKQDPINAIMMKQLVLTKGSLTNLLKYVNPAKELLKTAKKIETYF